VSAFYLTLYWVIPKYLSDNRRWWYFIGVSGIMIIGLSALELLLGLVLKLPPIYQERIVERSVFESFMLLSGFAFFKVLVVFPLSFMTQFIKDLIVEKKVTMFAEISLHIVIIGMLFTVSMTAPPHWSPENEPYLFLFKIIYKLLILFTNLSFFYINAFWFIPRFLAEKKYAQYLSLVLLLFIFAVTLEYLIYQVPLFSPEQSFRLKHSIRTDVGIKAVILLISFLYKFSKDWFRSNELTKQLQSEKLAAELDLLKFQIHPHFLFNTLNNIYSLALHEESPRTVQSLGKLGGMMHYMLEECQQEKVTIEQEIEYVKQYIDLQKLRMDKSIAVNAQIEITPEGKLLKVSPMLMIPFIENAFKHGISISEPSFININIDVKEHALKVRVENSWHGSKIKNDSVGFGLKNVQRRLQTLYPGHQLLTLQSGNTFVTDLTVKLN
jgi:hypothetical protein